MPGPGEIRPMYGGPVRPGPILPPPVEVIDPVKEMRTAVKAISKRWRHILTTTKTKYDDHELADIRSAAKDLQVGINQLRVPGGKAPKLKKAHEHVDRMIDGFGGGGGGRPPGSVVALYGIFIRDLKAALDPFRKPIKDLYNSYLDVFKEGGTFTTKKAKQDAAQGLAALYNAFVDLGGKKSELRAPPKAS